MLSYNVAELLRSAPGTSERHDVAVATMPIAEEVELVVTLPGGKPFLAMGEIKHVTETRDEPHHFGLHFTALAGSHRAALEHYVRSRQG